MASDKTLQDLQQEIAMLKERVFYLEQIQELETQSIFEERGLEPGTEMEIDWTDVPMERIDALLNDIFADEKPAELPPVEYNKLSENVIEFPVKFDRN